MESLVAGECGGANPLVKLSTIYQQGSREQNIHLTDHERADSYVPSTFDMNQLLAQAQNIQPTQTNHKQESSWRNEYLKQANMDVSDGQVVKMKPTIQRSYQSNSVPQYYPITRPNAQMVPSYMQQNFHQRSFIYNQQPKQEENWAHDYLEEAVGHFDQSSAALKTAKEMLESIDQQIDHQDSTKTAEEWIKEYHSEEAIDLVEPISQGIINGEQNWKFAEKTYEDTAYWQKLQEDWNELFSQEQFQNENDSYMDCIRNEYSQDYSYEESNPFQGLKEAFEEGLKKLEAGDLISAILLFEEAVQQDPTHAQAWQYLGTSQAENEQEVLAIRALNKCTELQADNLTARMALAVSYANESLQSQACNALKSWIGHHPRYSHLLQTPTSNEATASSKFNSSIMSGETFKEVETLYLSAARLAPQGDIDPEIQVGLGVLFNISGDYTKAVDCFKTALQVDPQSAFIWNKMGATLANSGRSEEATQAYRNALQARPGFIRCRYNLGISCINMKAYNEAIGHFLTALNMQKQGENPSRSVSTMSENIWTTLRMTISLLGKLELMKVVSDRDLKTLNEVFGVS